MQSSVTNVLDLKPKGITHKRILADCDIEPREQGRRINGEPGWRSTFNVTGVVDLHHTYERSDGSALPVLHHPKTASNRRRRRCSDTLHPYDRLRSAIISAPGNRAVVANLWAGRGIQPPVSSLKVCRCGINNSRQKPRSRQPAYP
jgi:hypothetical protein